jgi:hypothetical protein
MSNEGERTDVVIVTMRTVLVALLIDGHVLPECLLALFAHEGHFGSLCERMGLGFRVAFRAVIPELATWGADGDLRV